MVEYNLKNTGAFLKKTYERLSLNLNKSLMIGRNLADLLCYNSKNKKGEVMHE